MEEKINEKLIERIRKILSRTEDSGCTPAEAEAAFAKASTLMAEHNLSMEDVRHTTNGSESWIEDDLCEAKRWTLEDNLCYGILKEFYFVEGFFWFRDGFKVFVLFGKPENVTVARNVWVSLKSAFDRHWITYKILNQRPASEKRLFVAGMAKGFSRKLQDEREAQIIERDLVSGKKGTAIVLVSIAEKTKKALKLAHPGLRAGNTGPKAATGDQSTLDAGYQAGRKLNLNKGIGGRGQKGIGN